MADVARCLEHGTWQTPPWTPRNLSLLSRVGGHRYQCANKRAEHAMEKRSWQPAELGCARLHDALRDDFDGAFARDARPVHVLVLGDSLGAQVRSALDIAIGSNPRALGGLRFGTATTPFRPVADMGGLAVIPKTAAGNRMVLSSIQWPGVRGNSRANLEFAKVLHRAQSLGVGPPSAAGDTGSPSNGGGPPPLSARHERGATSRAAAAASARAASREPVRIILAGSGMWYNLRPYCNGTGFSLFGTGENASCTHAVLGRAIGPSDVEMDDDRPFFAKPYVFTKNYHIHFGTPPWGWYAWGRRLRGTATIAEYARDVGAFLDASLEYAANASAHIVWLETTPQHFRTPVPRRALTGAANAAAAAAGCSPVPATPIAEGEAYPPELDALCGTTARGDGGSGGSPAAATDADDGSTTTTTTTACRGDWRNRIARRLAAARGVPVVPLAAALATRHEMHTGLGGDCTHWCEGTETHAFLATAVLNVLKGVVQRAA